MSKVSWKNVVENCIYATVGVAIEVQESLPKIASKGRASLEPKLNVAKYVGQFAVANVERELQKQSRVITEQLSELITGLFGLGGSEVLLKDEDEDTVALWSETGLRRAASSPVVPPETPDESVNLPISGYTTLSAQQVIVRLGSLDAAEADVIGIYEARHRNRASILRAIASKKQDG